MLCGAIVLVVRAGDDHDRKVQAADATTTSSSTTSSSLPAVTTTYDLQPETTTTTVARTTTTAAPASTTTTTAAAAPVVSGSGTLLRAPSGSTTVRKMKGEDCESLADDGWTPTCGFASVKGGSTLVWLVEEQAVARRVFVWGAATSAGAGGGNWRVLLQAADETGSKWSSVTVRVLDLSGDGKDEIVVGYRAKSGGALAVDVVEGPAQVAVHRDLAQGVARVSPGQLDTWASSGGSGAFQHDVIRWQDGAWRLVLRSQVAAADVPPSQF